MRRACPSDLSRRELEIAKAFAAGAVSREVSARFGIAQSTVKTHLLSIYGKLGVSTKVGLAAALHPTPQAAKDPGCDGRPARIAVLRPFDPTASEAGLQLTGAAAQALTAALGAYPDVRIALSVPGRPMPRGADLADVARDLRVDYLAVPSVGAAAEGADLMLHLADRDGVVRSTVAGAVPLPCPRDRVSEIAGSFALQVAGMRGEIVRLEAQRRLIDETRHADAYGCYLAANDHLEVPGAEAADTAVTMAARAVALEPGFSRAWLMLAWCRHSRIAYGWAADDPPEREVEYFRRAAALAPEDGLPLAYLALASAKAGSQAEAVRLIEHATMRARRAPDVAAELTLPLATVAGRPDRALWLIEEALGRCPNPPREWYYMEARAAFFAGDPERALRAADLGPDWIPTLVVRALAAAELDDSVAARRAWTRLCEIAPSFDFAIYARQLPITHPTALGRYVASVRKLMAVLGDPAYGGDGGAICAAGANVLFTHY